MQKIWKILGKENPEEMEAFPKSCQFLYKSVYFEIGFILRESFFLNAILSSSEVWYDLKKSEIEILENLDKI